MNHEDGADAWGSQRPETPPWDAAEYSQLISAGPLLPLLEQYADIATMHDNKKITFAMFAMMKMSFYLCPTMSFFAGSYDQNTFRGAPWQVQPQGANTAIFTGNQPQLASMANQGNAKPKKTHTAVDVKNGHAKKLARGLTSYHG